VSSSARATAHGARDPRPPREWPATGPFPGRDGLGDDPGRRLATATPALLARRVDREHPRSGPEHAAASQLPGVAPPRPVSTVHPPARPDCRPRLLGTTRSRRATRMPEGEVSAKGRNHARPLRGVWARCTALCAVADRFVDARAFTEPRRLCRPPISDPGNACSRAGFSGLAVEEARRRGDGRQDCTENCAVACAAAQKPVQRARTRASALGTTPRQRCNAASGVGLAHTRSAAGADGRARRRGGAARSATTREEGAEW
jgi:hypothetical protein